APEVHLPEVHCLLGYPIPEPERLERLTTARPQSVGPTDLQAARTTVDDPRGDAGVVGELRRLDDPGRAGADDQDVHGVREVGGAVYPRPRCFLDAWIVPDVAMMVELHCSLPTMGLVNPVRV